MVETIADLDRLHAAAVRECTGMGDSEVVWHCWGSGPLVILLHGGGGSWRHWVRTIPALAADHALLVPDMPGFGESRLPEGAGGFAAMVDGLLHGIEELVPSGQAFALVGFSLGGRVAALLAEALGDRVRQLVIVGTSPVEPNPAPAPYQIPLRGLEGEALEEAHRANLGTFMFADPAHVDPLAVAISLHGVSRRSIRRSALIGLPIMTNALPATRAPVAMLFGEGDWVAHEGFDAIRTALARLRPDADLTILPGAGHWAMYEQATSFNQWLRARLTDSGRT